MKTITLKVSTPLQKKIVESSIIDKVSISSFLRKTINCYFEKSESEKLSDTLKKNDDTLSRIEEKINTESKCVREALIALASKDIVLSKKMEKLM